MTRTAPELDTAAAVLDAVRQSRTIADREEARILTLAVDWAAMHSTDSIDDAACDWYGDHPIPVAGPGAPLVAEFSIADFATALRLPTEVGKAYVGEALELRYRLPQTWQQVVDGKLPAWRARRIARATIGLSREAAAYVDSKVWFSAHTIRTTALDRLIETAIAQFMPDEADARAKAAGTAGTSTSTPATTTSTGCPAPPPSTAPSTSPTPSTSSQRSRRPPDSSRSSAPRTPSTYAGPWPSARSPDASSPSTSPPTTATAAAVPTDGWSFTYTSPRKRLPRQVSAGWATSGSPFWSSRSGPGAEPLAT